MMCAFNEGNIDGKGKAACIGGVVERGCEESACVCEGEAFRAPGGQEAASYSGRGRAEGDGTWNQVPVDSAESSVAFVVGFLLGYSIAVKPIPLRVGHANRVAEAG
jgi:hypothetical protein